jgi:short-chain fatty acids transporter
MTQTTTIEPVETSQGESRLARAAIAFSAFAERWYPDSFVFAALAAIGVAFADLLLGAEPRAVANAFGNGFWTLIPFTMQMAIVVISGYVVATSPPIAKFVDWIAKVPRTGRGAVAFIAFMAIAVSLLNYALSMIFGGLLALALARRTDLKMDFRAAAAAAYIGNGATWALGLSSSAAMLQANPASLPKAISDITGLIPYSQTIFLWQSMVMALIIWVVCVVSFYFSAPAPAHARTAAEFGVDLTPPSTELPKFMRPGEWFERTPFISVLVALLGFGFLWEEFSSKSPLVAISNLNTYNLMFLMVGLLLHWRLRSFLLSVARAVPTTAGILIQFPLYGSIAALLTGVKGTDGVSLAQHLTHFFVSIATTDTFPVVIGIYSSILGFLIPSGGGKWIVEAPYVMQAAKDLHTHLGWTVEIYNAAEALPNLVNPFWMLPLLGLLGLKARDMVGFTFTQLLINVPVVLFLLWLFAKTLVPA